MPFHIKQPIILEKVADTIQDSHHVLWLGKQNHQLFYGLLQDVPRTASNQIFYLSLGYFVSVKNLITLNPFSAFHVVVTWCKHSIILKHMYFQELACNWWNKMVRVNIGVEQLRPLGEGIWHLPNPIRALIGSLKGHNLVLKNLQCYLYLLEWPVESHKYLLTH